MAYEQQISESMRNSVSQEMAQLKRSCEQEQLSLKNQNAILEEKNKSLQRLLDAQRAENADLTKLCDDLIAKLEALK